MPDTENIFCFAYELNNKSQIQSQNCYYYVKKVIGKFRGVTEVLRGALHQKLQLERNRWEVPLIVLDYKRSGPLN